MYNTPRFSVSAVAMTLLWTAVSVNCGSYKPRSDIGYPAGLIPNCKLSTTPELESYFDSMIERTKENPPYIRPGVMKNATISTPMLQQLQIAIQKLSKGIVQRRSLPISTAWKSVVKDKDLDLKNRKTVLYAVGFLDSSIFPHSQAIGNTYAKRGYNVFITETMMFLTYIYPKSVRLTRAIGKKVGEFLVRLHERGLDPDKLELVGASLGAHIVAYAAKHFYQVTGKKPFRVTGLDPAGPCYRSLPPAYKLAPTDGQFVDVIHTNIDGFGMAERLGHVDFYVNGGEFQPSDIPYIPCLVICSHVRAIIYWWQAIEHPKKFIGMKCDSVQDARLANCFKDDSSDVLDVNYLGLATNFSSGKHGVYYLATHNEFPYYRAKEGLKKANEIYTSVIRNINSDDGFVV